MKSQEVIDIVARGIQNRSAYVSYTGARPEAVLREVFQQNPKLACNFTEVKPSIQRKGGFLRGNTYTLQFIYDADLPPYEDIILDDGKWLLSTAWEAGMHRNTYVISTNNVKALQQRLNDDVPDMGRVCPSFIECSFQSTTNRLSSQALVYLTCKYSIALNEQNQMDKIAEYVLDQVFSRYFGGGKTYVMQMPEHVRSYLPYSYIQQHVTFVDQPMDIRDATYDAAADTVYSVLSKHRGSAIGIAITYKALVERLHLTCQLVSGHAGTGDSLPPHTWCIVRAGEGYHHVDPSFGINGDAVCVDGFLQSDREMQHTHQWDRAAYPACTLRTPSYYEVKNYIEMHYDDILNAGVDEDCFNPDNVDW